MENSGVIRAARITFKGIVQGVGFRPHVYRIAKKYNIHGTVKNDTRGVEIIAEGSRENIESFYRELYENPPVLARIDEKNIEYIDPSGFKEFRIVKSSADNEGFTPISPDIATCDDCLRELFDPGDRRFMYPFINCTNCGPRFTIIEAIPYDRKNTTMSEFPMCDECMREYEDPLDRRYHAQPNACHVCGPHVELVYPVYKNTDVGTVYKRDEAIDKSVELLNGGKIIAIKGLGGFHLALYPRNEETVIRLRERKRRPAKPFALMVRDLETARRYCYINREEENLLTSRRRPIVLVKKREDIPFIPVSVAPDTDYLGLMLPYTPLHHIIMRKGPEILIMTSANISEEPLVYKNEEAFTDLNGIADALLLNNRRIARSCDDSVTMVVEDSPVLIRRSRGYVPEAIYLNNEQRQIIAMGSYEKNTFCVVKGKRAFVSHHIGDLSNEKSVDAYTRGIKDFLAMFRCRPEAVVCDMHPDYFSTIYGEEFAERNGIPVFYVQHHYAHIASVMAEHGITEAVIGVSFDGTGYGPDETVWGGEFLVADGLGFERAGHFRQVRMPGGEKAILEISRMALSYIYDAFGSNMIDIPFFEKHDSIWMDTIFKMIAGGINSPYTSSCGRLFDAVSSLAGLCDRPQYDAQGAILLEKYAGYMDDIYEVYSYDIFENVIDFRSTIKGIVKDIKRRVPVEVISRKFHGTIVKSGVEMCTRISKETGIKRVVLSGGSFQNRNLLHLFEKYLSVQGFEVYISRSVPPNDGGISLGQAYVGINKMMKE